MLIVILYGVTGAGQSGYNCIDVYLFTCSVYAAGIINIFKNNAVVYNNIFGILLLLVPLSIIISCHCLFKELYVHLNIFTSCR